MIREEIVNLGPGGTTFELLQNLDVNGSIEGKAKGLILLLR